MNRSIPMKIPDINASQVRALAGKRILVLGDVILDEYITGKAARMSREAPIPVLEFQSRRLIPGGAANPASNIVALGSQALQVGIVGADDTAQHLRDALIERGIDVSTLITVPDKPTTLKTRILAQMGLRFPQQVARIDTLSRDVISEEVVRQVVDAIEAHMPTIDAVLISDYHNGLLLPELLSTVLACAQSHGVPLFADVQGQLQKYAGFDLVKCNADDAAAYLRRGLTTNEDFAQAATDLYQRLAITDAMVITRGAEGATIHDGAATLHIPAPQVSDVFDTVGAGDTWIAVMTLARITGMGYMPAALLANIASGVVVRHVGNYTPTPQELIEALDP